jgi:hypothetical protein
MIVQVSTATYIGSERLVDATSTPVTTKVNTDWTKTATLLGTATTATPTITHRANGYYDISCTFPSVGVWSVEYSVVVDGSTVVFDPRTVQAFTAAQIDPVTALASSFAALPDNADIAALATSIDALPTTSDITAALSGYSVTVVSPIAASGAITIVRGDDYSNADSRALSWTDDGSTWPDLTGATITFGAKNRLGNQTVTATGSVIVATGTGKTVRVELAAADTATKTAGTWAFDVQASLASGRDVTLATGTMTLVEDYAP